MKVEIVTFYPNKKKEKDSIKGTLHVYLCDLDLDLRGIPVTYNPTNKWLFLNMPHQTGWDEEEQKMGKYPVFNFCDKEKQKDLINALRKAAKAYFKESKCIKETN